MNLIKNLYKLNFTWYSEREKHNYFVEMSQNKKKNCRNELNYIIMKKEKYTSLPDIGFSTKSILQRF